MMNDESEGVPADGVICAAEASIYTKSNIAPFKHSIYSCELWQRPDGSHNTEKEKNVCVCASQVLYTWSNLSEQKHS